ncbi:MAG TPA: HIT domain-containing protein [Actinomycetota bacterium]|nr:HIT domain-containing protein [Actinomycetota bacterium]
MQYVTTSGGDDGCIFCDHLAAGDEVLYRGPSTFVLLNAFPYNTGHLMVAPQRHVGELGDLSEQERHELMDLSAESVRIVREAMSAHGFNVGMNLGDVAGAGIPGHLHVHVVPRWGGDTNFMTTVGETKVLPEMLADTAAKLKPLFDRLPAGGGRGPF